MTAFVSGVCPDHGAWASRTGDECPRCAGRPMVRVGGPVGEDDFTHYFNATVRLSAENTALRGRLDEIRAILADYNSSYGCALRIREVLDR